MGAGPFLRQGALQVVAGDRLVKGGALERRARLRRRHGGVDPPAAGPRAVRRTRHIGVGAPGLLLEGEARVHDDVGLGQAAEPFRHGCLGPGDRLLRGPDELLAAPEREGRVGPEALEQRREIVRAEAAFGDGPHLGFERGHLLQSELVQRLGIEVPRGVPAHQGAVALGAMRQGREGRRGPGAGDVVGREEVAIPADGRQNGVRHHRDHRVAESRGRVPRGDAGERRARRRDLQDAVELLEHGLGVGPRLGISGAQALAQVGDLGVDIVRHRAPAGQGVRPELCRAHRLQLGDHRQVDLPATLLVERPQLRAAHARLARRLEGLEQNAIRRLLRTAPEGLAPDLRQPVEPGVFMGLPGTDGGEGIVPQAVVGSVGHAGEQRAEGKGPGPGREVLVGEAVDPAGGIGCLGSACPGCAVRGGSRRPGNGSRGARREQEQAGEDQELTRHGLSGGVQSYWY